MMNESLHVSSDLDQPLPPEAQALLDQFKRYAVQHPRLIEVETQLLHTIWEPADVAFAVVCGPSGVGKSTMVSHLARRLNVPRQPSNLHENSHLAALLLNTRPPDGELFNRTDYYRKGLTHLGRTTLDRRVKVDISSAERTVENSRGPRRKTTAYQDDPELRDAYEEELRRQTVRAVILDEAQHLSLTSDGKQPKDQLNWLKSMTTETSVLHILVGTYDLLPFCNLDGQMARRGLEIHFPRYHIEDELDCQAFRNALSSLLKQIPLQVDHDTLIQRWWYFFEGSIGCIGILKQWLVRVLYLALREGSSELTLAHLEQRILSDAKWARMNADARSGEAELQYVDGQRERQFRTSGLPTAASKEFHPMSRPGTALSAEDSTVESISRKTNGSVGQRSPHRDEVGKTNGGKSSTKCSFSGPVTLDAPRLVQSLIQEVQCPTCGSVSKAMVKGQAVVISPHRPRTARAVRNVARWVEQGTEWVPVQKKE